MQDEGPNPKEYKFFLERIANSLHVPYFLLYVSITLLIEVGRIVVDYITIVKKLGFSADDLVALWSNRWLIFLWPICMFLMYYSMRYLRNYTLYTLKQIRPRLKEYPINTLEKVFRSPIQHLIPSCFIIICVSYFAYMWYSNSTITFYFTTGQVYYTAIHDTPLNFLHAIIWITYNWSIGGYFSWICIGTIIVIFAASKQVKHIDVFHHDLAGGIGVMGSLAMKTALLYIFSVSFMFPGWIMDKIWGIKNIGFVLQLGALSGLAIMEIAIFLLPMIFFHHKMKDAKEKQLAKLDALIVNFHDSLVQNSIAEKDYKKFENTLTLRQIAKSMQEYPFNVRMLIKVSSIAFIPDLIVISQRVVEFMLSSGS